jgi:diketogulonate reductase-like aldo/keto reductase
LSVSGLIADVSFIPLPKSDTKERIAANIDIYDFELSGEQMDKLNALDQDEHVCINVTDCP